ncbi:hypothetical protein ABID19_000370 [Mesorhizobium robiniae]|uniref:Uncharacterized protein n=1 Tax=Mesorhizobium robiniae TaxID=559315 RepID=A0ABV2GGE0_9HYPH
MRGHHPPSVRSCANWKSIFLDRLTPKSAPSNAEMGRLRADFQWCVVFIRIGDRGFVGKSVWVRLTHRLRFRKRRRRGCGSGRWFGSGKNGHGVISFRSLHSALAGHRRRVGFLTPPVSTVSLSGLLQQNDHAWLWFRSGVSSDPARIWRAHGRTAPSEKVIELSGCAGLVGHAERHNSISG